MKDEKHENPVKDTDDAKEQEKDVKAEEKAPEEEKKQAAEDEKKETPPEDQTEEKKKSEGSSEKLSKKDKRDEVIDDLTDKLKRQMAEFENFRKRTEKEKDSMFDSGARSVIERILPVVDNFERALGANTKDADDAFRDGIEKIYKGFEKVLSDLDVKPIECVGQEFNPDFHNAVMHVEDDSVGENIIVEELQKGYTYHGRVVRHSMVKVAN